MTRTTRLSPLARLLRAASAPLGAGLLVLASGCASTGGGGSEEGSGSKLRVTLKDYAPGLQYELVSESHTDRVEYYSQERSEASRKIQNDAVMDALVDYLDDQGFEQHAQDGRAPSRGGAVITRAFEVERDGTTHHWVIGKGSAAKERVEFNECVKDFLALYNSSAAFQAIENRKGHAFFDEATSSTRR